MVAYATCPAALPQTAAMTAPDLSFRNRLHIIIDGTDTPAGRTFDAILIVLIIVSVLVIMLDSVEQWHQQFREVFWYLEWGFTLLFTLEYLLRLYSMPNRWRYATSFFGIVDLLSILPSYLSILLPGSQNLLVVRVLRILRIFRILKLTRYLEQANFLLVALRGSRQKIIVFFTFILTLVTISGALLYVVEGHHNGFTSIPKSIYWAIVTFATVGYGDMTPKTGLGQFIASVVILLGYTVLAVPTGIFSAELNKAHQQAELAVECPTCGERGHARDAHFCDHCGGELHI